MTYVITQSCCNDASCVEVCPVDCIHPAPDEPGFAAAEMLYIHPDECIDCGACEDACPVNAIFPDYEVPDAFAPYTDINAAFFEFTGEQGEPAPVPSPGAKVAGDGPLKVAVVGAGPAGWYVAEELAATRRCDVEITVIDRLATPYGLVRHGVAPDHLDTKEVVSGFAKTARHRRVRTRYNVEVGRDVTHEELLAAHHAVVYTTGAGEGRTLGLTGEELPGSTSAAELVGWYNGHPDRVALTFPLDHERAVVIGNGNVALDLARLLLAEEDVLTASDLAPAALDALCASGIREVVVTARRGPEFAAFTSPELRALADDSRIEVVVDEADLATLPIEADLPERTAGTFAALQKADLLRGLAARPRTDAAKRLVLRFGLTPIEILGTDTVTGVRFDGGEEIEAGLVVRATGYRSAGVDGVPTEEGTGRFPHEAGRVTGVEGTYTAGWAKRGPSGVIGTNRACAAETVRTLLDDHAAGALPAPTGQPLDELLTDRGVTVIDHAGWNALDAHERKSGKEIGRPRLKVTDPEEQVRIAAPVRA
ncbi:ferredoxin--NADP+ reductase [Nocardioides luteus]|uniref:ferredoxin--NADP(+) reductase n=1 Tax=Nocardioides luteus TaxID=1844 RepID=A0ABQ5SZW8_9ACTN|nr:FAD-dependent oxidoreductase [Nocardioides luteus]MDR7310685.1 ferredoxin--NADP+ reductase [Nocardioides luteus]GGR41273.1 ferredoxin [Nocardioides luteus]GLJ69534.1 ferredoxin [Nocardioides luteus]